MNEAESARVPCLFWNLHQQSREELICHLVQERQIEILILAEHGNDGEESLLRRMQEEVDEEFFEPESEVFKLKVIARNPSFRLNEIYADISKRLTIRSLIIDEAEILLAAVHLVSNVDWDKNSQTAEADVLAHQIRKREVERGHSRTILLGDFNMNPFDPGVVQATGFHAAMTKATALAETRTVQGREYPFFYNPMWGFFGIEHRGLREHTTTAVGTCLMIGISTTKC